MGFSLDEVVPWGRSYDEYVRMFGLSEANLGLRILGCGDGPAAFNAVLTGGGGTVLSVDPLYMFKVAQIEERIAATCEAVLAQLRGNQNDYVWREIASVDELGTLRMAAMETFLADFDAGKRQGRYVAAALPCLPFADGVFDLALSSHFLLLYSAHLSAAFHLQAFQEMLRVSREVRVFPLLALDGTPSPHLPSIKKGLQQQGYEIETRRVPYEFQRGGNELLIVSRADSGLTLPSSRQTLEQTF